MRAGIEPGKAATHQLHTQLAILQKHLVDRGNLQLTACRRLDVLGHLHHLVGVEIEPHDGIVALGLLGLFLDAEHTSLGVELGHTVALGVGHPVAEDGGATVNLDIVHRLAQHTSQAVAMEDIVAQHQTDIIVANELLADNERLRQPVGRRLLGITEMHAEVAAVAQKALESRQVVRSRNNQYVTDAGQHQHADGIVHHRLVVDGQQLFADAFGDGI